MRQVITDTLRRLQDEKQSKRIVPDHVLFPELMNAVQKDIREELNAMARDGTIQVIETINAKAIKLK